MDEVMMVKVESLGFGRMEAADMIKKHGKEVLDMLAKGLEHGISKDLIVEVLQLGGKIGLELLLEWKTASTNVMVGGVVEGDQVDSFGEVQKSVFSKLLDKYLPMLFEKLGPVLMERFGPMLTDLLLKMLTKK